MSAINDGGPITSGMELRQTNDIQELTPVGGLSIRDWMAGMALQGIIGSVFCTPEVTFDECSGRAYAMADAMLSARERKEEP